MYNYFREIFKSRDFMNILRNFEKSVFAQIFAKYKYFAEQFILWNLQIMCFKTIYSIICSYF